MTLTQKSTRKRLAVGAAMVILLSGGVSAAVAVPSASTAAIARHSVSQREVDDATRHFRHGADDVALHVKHGADDGVGHPKQVGDDGIRHA
jgi:hypothetical protein